MRGRVLGALAVLALLAGLAGAETLGELVRARGVPPPGRPIPLEPFREVRAELSRWDGQGAPPAALYRDLAAGLSRARNLKSEAHVSAAMAAEPVLGPLLAAALASRAAVGQDARSWLVGLDARWADAETWRGLARAVATPDELTEVVHVCVGLRWPGAPRCHELLRTDFDSRFGPGAPGRALEPAVLRRLFPTAADGR